VLELRFRRIVVRPPIGKQKDYPDLVLTAIYAREKNEPKVWTEFRRATYIVFDLYDTADVTAELIGGNGQATETIRYANIVSFTCLKSIAYDDRQERKDAHELVYCLEHVPQKGDALVALFRDGLGRKHQDVIRHSLTILRNRFVTDGNAEGLSQGRPGRGCEVRTRRR
jgi:hypothetical protein